MLLSRPADEVRADGGIGSLWATAGGPSMEIVEIDYAEVLREKQGDAAVADRLDRRGDERRAARARRVGHAPAAGSWSAIRRGSRS